MKGIVQVRPWLVGVSLWVFVISISFAQTADSPNGLTLHGYGRTKVGALVNNGDYFISENALNLRMNYSNGPTDFYANPILYERSGVVQTPDLREVYLDYHQDLFDLRVGKQQIIWGKGDGVFITDLISTKDLSQFLVPDFEEIRRAVTATKFDLYQGYHSLELVWVPWFTPTISPASTSMWAPSIPFPIQPTVSPADAPSFTLENSEYFAKYSYLGESFDGSIMGGWLWNDTPAFTVVSKTITPPAGLTALTVKPEYYQTYVVGYTASATAGPLILRSEGAYYGVKRYQGNLTVFSPGYAEKPAIQYLVGADYSIAGITMGLQFIQNVILDYDSALLDDQFKNTVTLMVSRTFLRETVKTEVFSYVGLKTPDALIKPKITWTVADGFELFTGAFLFLGDSGDFGQYHDNNGVYVGAKLSF